MKLNTSNSISGSPHLLDVGGCHLFSKEVGNETCNDREWIETYFNEKNDLPTKYSEENIDECFAECFAHYCLGLQISKGFKEYLDTYFKEFDNIIHK